MTETWLPWPEAKPLPLNETYIFEIEVKLRPSEQKLNILRRWLNAKHPEQNAIEQQAFYRQQRGEPLFLSKEDAEQSRNSELLKAHYEVAMTAITTMMMELHSDGRITVIGPKYE